jgi:hypothetical protein
MSQISLMVQAMLRMRNAMAKVLANCRTNCEIETLSWNAPMVRPHAVDKKG